MKKILLFLTLITLLFTSCKKEAFEDVLAKGRWNIDSYQRKTYYIDAGVSPITIDTTYTNIGILYVSDTTEMQYQFGTKGYQLYSGCYMDIRLNSVALYTLSSLEIYSFFQGSAADLNNFSSKPTGQFASGTSLQKWYAMRKSTTTNSVTGEVTDNYVDDFTNDYNVLISKQGKNKYMMILTNNDNRYREQEEIQITISAL